MKLLAGSGWAITIRKAALGLDQTFTPTEKFMRSSLDHCRERGTICIINADVSGVLIQITWKSARQGNTPDYTYWA